IEQEFVTDAPICNLTIDKNHSFAVGNDGILVHNDPECPWEVSDNAPKGLLEGLKGVPWGKYMPNGCEEIAKKIQSAIGGTIHRIKPNSRVPGAGSLGPRSGMPTNWAHHEVVVKDGIVYDALTGPNGLSIADYKELWEYADDIDFGF
ncbi:MAG: hypothetical protein JNL67_18745, partial [Planctomycetaceae bacterium]|nr:hypothetical protein [Planctomycetaceae bacterium]